MEVMGWTRTVILGLGASVGAYFYTQNVFFGAFLGVIITALIIHFIRRR